MLSLHEALELDFSCGAMDVGVGFGFGFDTCEPAMTVQRTDLPTANVQQAVGDDGEEECQRRLRRKMSNRESARRSRARKQLRLEELQRAGESLRVENLAMVARLRTAVRCVIAVRRDNARLQAEAGALRHRLSVAHRHAVMLSSLSQLLRPMSPGGVDALAPAAPVVGLPSLMS